MEGLSGGLKTREGRCELNIAVGIATISFSKRPKSSGSLVLDVEGERLTD